jgi:hypothetical protein
MAFQPKSEVKFTTEVWNNFLRLSSFVRKEIEKSVWHEKIACFQRDKISPCKTLELNLASQFWEQ